MIVEGFPYLKSSEPTLNSRSRNVPQALRIQGPFGLQALHNFSVFVGHCAIFLTQTRISVSYSQKRNLKNVVTKWSGNGLVLEGCHSIYAGLS